MSTSRRYLAALVVALLALPATCHTLVAAHSATLGRDQGIFQYIAWATSRGELLYRDVRDVNGPLIAMIHQAFLALGGSEEPRFRLLDLVVTGVSFALAGALLPSMAGTRGSVANRALWALAAFAALSAQYLAYGFWDTAQRESFLDWFVLGSVALFGATAPGARREFWRLGAAGMLAVLPWFGKPTYVLFTLPAIAVLTLERAPWPCRMRRLGAFAAGGTVGALVPLLWLARHGDLASWLRMTLVDVPTMYRPIWRASPTSILLMPGYASLAWVTALTTIGLSVLIALGRLPVRAIAVVAMPALGLVSVVAQAKGFIYHFHPVTLGVTFGWLLAVTVGWEGDLGSLRRRWVTTVRALSIAGALAIGVHAAALLRREPFPSPSTPTADALDAFERVDFFPRALRDAASFVAAHTQPDERVQTYGMDPYLLFLARRLSATPYIYAFDLNADAALQGSEQSPRVRALRDAHEEDLQARLERSPPAAFVFVGRSPLMSEDDAVADFKRHCPRAAPWVFAHYREAADFNGIRVWMRIRKAR